MTAVIFLSISLFAICTWWCQWQGVFRNDPFGLGFLIGLVVYLLFWVTPSLTGWAIWATWFK